MTLFRRFVLFVLAFSLTACAAVRLGTDFDLKAFEARAQRGVTTQAQVREWLGAPNSTGVHVQSDGERFDEWTYYFGEGQLTGDVRLKLLQIKFDRAGTVRAFNWSGGK